MTDNLGQAEQQLRALVSDVFGSVAARGYATVREVDAWAEGRSASFVVEPLRSDAAAVEMSTDGESLYLSVGDLGLLDDLAPQGDFDRQLGFLGCLLNSVRDGEYQEDLLVTATGGAFVRQRYGCGCRAYVTSVDVASSLVASEPLGRRQYSPYAA